MVHLHTPEHHALTLRDGKAWVLLTEDSTPETLLRALWQVGFRLYVLSALDSRAPSMVLGVVLLQLHWHSIWQGQSNAPQLMSCTSMQSSL